MNCKKCNKEFCDYCKDDKTLEEVDLTQHSQSIPFMLGHSHNGLSLDSLSSSNHTHSHSLSFGRTETKEEIIEQIHYQVKNVLSQYIGSKYHPSMLSNIQKTLWDMVRNDIIKSFKIEEENKMLKMNINYNPFLENIDLEYNLD